MPLYRPILCIAVTLLMIPAVFGQAFGQAAPVSTRRTLGPSPLQVAVNTSPSNCNAGNGSIAVKATGGTPPYFYSFNGQPFQTIAYYADAGPDVVQVTVMDATGATATITANVGNNYPQVECTAAILQYPTGCAGTDGSVQLSPLRGVAPYSYSVDYVNWQTSNVFSGLPPGDYNFYIKDANGCIGSIHTPISGAGCNVGFSVGGSGSICTGTATLGMSPLNVPQPVTYSLDGLTYQSNEFFPNLTAGYYDIHMKDGAGNIYLFRDYLYPLCFMVPSVTLTDATCGNSDGSIVASAVNGTPPYSYSMDGFTYQPGNTFTGLAPGSYTLFFKDATGWVRALNPKVNSGCQLSLTLAGVNTTCGNHNGSIIALASGGEGLYLYSIDATHFQFSPVFSNLAPGPYSVLVRDGDNNTAANGLILHQDNTVGIQLAITPTAASCLNDDGGFIASATGGTPPFQYAVDGEAFQPGPGFGGLSTGMHTVLVKDMHGCTSSGTVTVPLNNTLSVDAGGGATICQGASQGAVLAGVSNGTQFAWSPATGLNNTSLLQPVATPSVTTTYTLTAMLGVCQGTSDVTVNVTPAPIADAGRDTSVCYGGSVELNGSGGVSYQWSPATGLDNPDIQDPTVLAPKKSVIYQLMVTDASGCASLQPATVKVTVIPTPSIYIGNDTTILGGQPVPLNVEDLNNSGFVSYAWTPVEGLSDPSIRDPVASVYQNTTYTVVATTAGGCSASAGISLKVFTAAGIFVPNAFTPNGDGHNDVLKAIPVGIGKFRYFAVYARSGQRVFFTSDPGQGWDGTVGGQRSGAGTYVWMAAGIDYRGQLVEERGTVILIR